MIRFVTYGTIKEGKLKIINLELFKSEIGKLPEGNYVLTLEKGYHRRSNPQNAYLWGVVYPIVKEGLIDAGFDEFKQDSDLEMTHELCKFRFLQREIDCSRKKENGVYPYLNSIGSTRKLSTVEFAEYLELIGKWASEYLNVVIPDPNQQQYTEMNDL